MSEHFTRVEIAFYPEHLNHWLRFGEPEEHIDLDRQRSLAVFKSGQIFGYVRWCANEYGTQDWRFSVVQTRGQLHSVSHITGVYPGGNLLLFTNGNTKVKRALSQIDLLEVNGFDPAKVSPAYYRHIHNRILIGHRVCTYSIAQHEANLAARRVML